MICKRNLNNLIAYSEGISLNDKRPGNTNSISVTSLHLWQTDELNIVAILEPICNFQPIFLFQVAKAALVYAVNAECVIAILEG